MFSVEPRPPVCRAEHGCGGADISACAVQLCVEHGISNDGILEDFATQASVSNFHLPTLCRRSHQVSG